MIVGKRTISTLSQEYYEEYSMLEFAFQNRKIFSRKKTWEKRGSEKKSVNLENVRKFISKIFNGYQ